MNSSIDDTCRSPTEMSACDVGGKANVLHLLQAAGFRVPPFLVSPLNLEQAIERLGTPLAVRSSATAEDGVLASFAGQFRSFLNLNTLAEVEQAIASCHDSLSEMSVKQYCRKNNIRYESLRMEVIVQRMIQPELAGVAFTVNPANGSEEVTIEAVAGLADQLLLGRCESLPADAPLMQRYRDEIETVARQIQRHFGAPQDIEFAIESGMLWILQARPITRINFTIDNGQWTNADFRDGGVSSSVCTPLMWSLYEFVWERALKDSLRELKLLKHDFPSGRMFFGRPYWNLGAVKECLAELPGFNEREFDRDLSVQINYPGDGRVTPSTPSRVLRAIPTVVSVGRFLRRQCHAAESLLQVNESIELIPWRRLPAYAIPGKDELEGFSTSLAKLINCDYFNIEYNYFRTIFAVSLAKIDFCNSFPDADYGSLVAALPPLKHVAPVRDVQALGVRSPEKLSQIINTYSYHYRNGLDIFFPRWDDDRAFVMQMLAELPERGGTDPRPAYELARAEKLASLPWWQRKRFQRKLDRLRHLLWLREEMRDVSSRIYHVIRRHVLKIAELRELDDSVFFQTFQELLSGTRSKSLSGKGSDPLEAAQFPWYSGAAGEGQTPFQKDSYIERNREIYESYRNFSAPNEIGSGYRFDSSPATGAMHGIGASPGTLMAPAFIARTVDQAVQMPRGHILVCPFTDPGWTVVLDRAGGVVTETGGLLSHAAILCREYGIPAVLSVKDATKRIVHQNAIRIQGSNGHVEIVPATKRKDR